jgi:hypothetical protein
MSACPQYLPLLLDEVAGGLAAADAARLEAHRRACGGCRAEGAALASTISLVRLPPVEEAERRALDGLAASTGRALRRRAVARIGLGLGGALAAAGAAALLLVLPLTRPPEGAGRPPPPPPPPAAPASPAWQSPDPDSLWSEADLFEDEEPATTTAAAAALASLDF